MRLAAGSDPLVELLQRGWSGLSIGSVPRPDLSGAQAEALAKFARLLFQWNQVHSLTAVETLEAYVDRHLLDGLSAWPGLKAQRLCDVGSGTGVPGLPLALVMPGLEVTLVERVARKAAFLRHAIAQLGLAGRVTVCQQDVRDLRGLQPYEMMVSRAFAALESFIDWTFHLSMPGTQWLYMAGKLSEIKHLNQNSYHHPQQMDALVLDRIEPVTGTPMASAERNLVWIRRLT